MKLTKSENHDPNYLAAVIEMPEIKPHPNAERLELTEVFGNTIIIGKGLYVEGEKVIYFPVESCLSGDFLSWANLFDRPELNADEKTKGFFTKGNRVKAVSLRSIPSQGFLFKASKLAEYYKCQERDFKIGESFDTVDGNVLTTKYIRPVANSGQTAPSFKKSKVPRSVDKIMGYLPSSVRVKIYPVIKWAYGREKDGIKSSIVEGQFRLHYKTEHFGRNTFLLNPEDDIAVTVKCHGTSAIFANLLCKKEPTRWGKIKSLFGAKSNQTQYRFLYSSRSVLKNRSDGKYSPDVWGVHAAEINGKIPEGYSCYGEIVGWASQGKMIQSGYNYGVKQGNSEFWVYRITKVDEDGNFNELSWSEIEEFCNTQGFKTVPVYFKGAAKNLFPEVVVGESWREELLTALKDKYLDKKCEFHSTGVVNEGVVIKLNNKENKTALKFKSPKFVEKETKSRDSGEENLEEES